MKIYDGQGKEMLDITPNENSYRYRAIMNGHILTLYYELAEHIELPVGAYCDFQGARYTLMRPENLRMRHTRYFEYTVTFSAPEDKAKIWKVRNTADRRLKFTLTAKPKDHLKLVVDNMNRRESGWTVGDCIDATEQTVTYDHVYCLDALKSLASQFKTEYEFGGTNGKRVSLHKVEYNKDNPLPLSYGKGNGFKSGVGRNNAKDNPPTEILYVQGGTRNIDPSKYGSAELLLPKNQSIRYDGAHFEGESGFNSSIARIYVTDSDGFSIYRGDKQLTNMSDDSLDCSEIYPSRVGEVSAVDVVDAAKNFYDIIDNTIPDNLNFEDCLIEGETMTIIFQSGMLVGKEFEVKYYHNAEKGKAARRFEIVPQEIDGQIMPNASFIPKVGDKYAVFHCRLPQAYICDNVSKSGASWDMFRQAVKFLYDNEGEQFSFKGELDGIWAKKNWENIGGRIVVGGYIFFSDKQFQPEGAHVRITGVKEYINSPHSPIIELSNTTVTAGASSTIKDMQGQEVLIEQSEQYAIQFTKRRFRDAKETISMLEAALLDNFTNSITPIAVQTMSLLVGDESLQFRFVNSKTTPVQIAHQITWNNETKTLTADAGILQHMTLGIDSLSSDHEPKEYHFWDMAQYTSARLDSPETKYYLYAKVSTISSNGTFILSQTAIKMEQVTGFFHLLCGVLNSEYDGERSFVTLYGFTEILPGRITTDRIVSSEGTSFFDMLNNTMKLKDALDFNTKGDGKLRIKGTIVQSESGDEQPLGVFRGWFNNAYTYYKGDEVLYNINNQIVTYRYINDTPSKGHLPTDTEYWSPVAQGVKGDFVSRIFKRQNTKPSKPDGGTYESPVPSGWSDGVPNGKAIIWSSVCTFYGAGGSSEWSDPAPESDSDTLDIEFSPSLTQPSAPTGDMPFTNHESEGWYDPNSSNFAGKTMIWRAERKVSNGEYDGIWTVSRIYGEKGDQGLRGDFTSLFYTWAVSQPSKPTGNTLSPKGWHTSPDRDNINVSFSGSFSVGLDKYRYSPAIDNNQNISERLTFTTSKPNQIVAIDIKVSSEDDYDKAYISALDENGAEAQAWDNSQAYSVGSYVMYYQTCKTYICKVANSGVPPTNTAYWEQIGSEPLAVLSGSNTKKVYVFIPTAGTHYFYIGYIKDSSGSSGSDGCRYRVLPTENLSCWFCQAQVQGATNTVIRWSDVTRFIYDNATDESVYLISETDTTPVTPLSEPYIDDFVPPLVNIIYSSVTYYAAGNKVMYSGYAYVCIKACQGVAPTDINYWKRIPTWTDDPMSVDATYRFQYISIRHKDKGVWGAFSAPKLFSTFVKGDTGDYFEYRYAVNGSTSTAPDLSKTTRAPSGWSTSIPSVGVMKYLWMTVAKISGTDDTLIVNWSDPVRQTPYDGKDGADGKSPALVFRGVYNASKNYYGNANRVDCVKYNSTYYRARIDAPNGTSGFSGHAPTDSDYWNAFGASFESVATDLLLAENASIGDWFHSGGKIVSTLSTGNKIELDASIPQIKVTSEQSGGDYSEDTSLGSEITISGSTGVIRTQAKTSSSKVSYMSPSGIFSNVAETQAVSSITGYVRKAAMVALGYGSLAKSTWEMNKDEAMLAGVYGVANNNTYNGAPAYGGYFYDLKACGLILNVQYISDSNSEYTTLDKSASQIISLTNKDVTRKVYLPSDAYVGRVVFLHQMGAGALRVYAGLGQHIYDDTTENTYYDIGEGQTLMAIFGIWSKNNVRTEVWIVRRFKY